MNIELTTIQIDQILQDKCLRISYDSESLKGFEIYLEFGTALGFKYGEITKKPNADPRKVDTYVFVSDDLEKLKDKEPYISSAYEKYCLCPNPECRLPLIYHFKHCPECGQEIKWRQ